MSMKNQLINGAYKALREKAMSDIKKISAQIGAI